MNLFLETRQQQSERMERERRHYDDARARRQQQHEAAAKRESGEEYSVQMQEYRDELAYDKARGRRRKLLAALRVVLMVVGIPVALCLIFVGSYALTCIINGATPAELQELMAQLFERVRAFAVQLGL